MISGVIGKVAQPVFLAHDVLEDRSREVPITVGYGHRRRIRSANESSTLSKMQVVIGK